MTDQSQSILYLIAAGLLFVIISTLIKTGGINIPVIQIVAVRQIIMAIVVSPAIFRSFPESVITRHPIMHLLRLIGALGAITMGFTSIVHLPLADATAIAFAKGFFVTIFAIMILSETVGIRRWGATIIGFLGVVVMIRPGFETIDIYAIYAVAASMCAGFVMVMIRLLTRDERPITLITYQAVFIGLIAIPFAAYYWVTPTLVEWVIMIAIGMISVFAQLANINAFKLGEATMLASLDYLRLIWAALIGLIIFAEIPSMYTLIGAGIVIAAALYVIRREAQLNKKITREPLGRGLSQP